MIDFKTVTDELYKIHKAKNADYGSSFDKTCDCFGVIAAVVRICDKVERIKTLTKFDSKVKDESMLDTLKDLANYAILTIIWLKNNQTSGIWSQLGDLYNHEELEDCTPPCSDTNWTEKQVKVIKKTDEELNTIGKKCEEQTDEQCTNKESYDKNI